MRNYKDKPASKMISHLKTVNKVEHLELNLYFKVRGRVARDQWHIITWIKEEETPGIYWMVLKILTPLRSIRIPISEKLAIGQKVSVYPRDSSKCKKYSVSFMSALVLCLKIAQ